MLKLAIEAGLPLVHVTTRDTLNLPEVIKEISGKVPELWSPDNHAATMKSASIEGKVLYFTGGGADKLELHKIYSGLVKSGCTLLIVNGAMREPMFDAGEIPVPKSLLKKFLLEVVEKDDIAEALMRGLGGCTIKETAEYCRLTMARDSSLTTPGLMATRKASFQSSRGLTQVDTKQDFYEAPDILKEWVTREKSFFLQEDVDFRLRPRGMLFDGPPGTGKSAGSKWLAEQLGVPLYRVDIGGTKSKWNGESEGTMLTNLSRLDHEEPCVALFDEVEKVFSQNTSDSTGITSTMLSQLLWWLAERRTRVLVLMTTNNAKSLPKELHREGRIDQTIVFQGLTKLAAKEFVVRVLATFDVHNTEHADKVVARAFKLSALPGVEPEQVSQAALTTHAINCIKTGF